MNPADAEAAQAERAERLRQDTLAFDQRHKHRERWFTLRFAMGWVAVLSLPVVCFVASFVIFNYERFGPKAVTAASGVLLTVVALLATAWRRVLSASPVEDEPAADRALPVEAKE
ncbi:MAG TPA: hypothetical protein VNP96_11825 [Solirubrobacterales bacterium]|nr:hypothetical protein [Solirubrobacterales bacterium]